jgi:hypothetical protein
MDRSFGTFDGCPTTRCRRPRQFLLVVLLLSGIGVLGIMAWLRARDANPVHYIPGRVMPSPNAYDYCARAGRLLKDPHAVVDGLGQLQGKPDRRANGQLEAYSDSELNRFYEENQPAIRVLRAGFQYPYLNPPIRSFAVPVDDLTTDVELARQLLFDGLSTSGMASGALRPRMNGTASD